MRRPYPSEANPKVNKIPAVRSKGQLWGKHNVSAHIKQKSGPRL